MTDNFQLLRGDIGQLRANISRLDAKIDGMGEAIRSEISALKNVLIASAFAVVAAVIGSSAF